MPTPHNTAEKGQIAKLVLMPGDPLRAKFIADTFLKDVVQFNAVRNMFGFTGTYKGHPISVMGSGMGMPSIGIYSYELFAFYGVETIIRIGSAGSYTAEAKMLDVVLADSAYSDSTFAKMAYGFQENVLLPGAELNAKIIAAAKELGIPLHVGRIHSSDCFYSSPEVEGWESKAKRLGLTCVEMESFALFANARYLGKQAACLLTISDSLVTHEETTQEERQNSFTKMMEIALEIAVK